MTILYFYDIPVYRLPEEQYNRERNEHIDSMLFPEGDPYSQSLRQKEADDPSCNSAVRDHLQRSYGGCWKFNEIIGYIRLHFLGHQVRGEYFSIRKKRIVRTRTRVLEYLTWKLAPEVNIPRPYTNQGVYGAVLKYLADCRRELPRRSVDTELFEVIGKHVNWVDLIESQ